jgi:hypothetical protein
MPRLTDEQKTMLFVPVGGALGSLVERLIFFLDQAKTTNTDLGAALGQNAGAIAINVFVAAAVTLVAAILLDLNRDNRWRIFATSFLLGITWPGVWHQLQTLAQKVAVIAPT